MKKLLASLTLCSLSLCMVFSVSIPTASAAAALVAHTFGRSFDSNGFTTGAIDTTGANFIIIGLATAVTGGTISDSKGNTWHPLTEWPGGLSGDRQFRFFYCESCTVGSGHTFTVANAAGAFPTLLIEAWSGIAAASSFDVENGNGLTFGTSISTNSVTPSAANELVVAGLQYDDSVTPTIDSGFTITDTNPNTNFGAQAGQIAYLIETTATAQNPTFSWTDGSRGTAGIATFKTAAAANGRIIRIIGHTRLIGGIRLE
jgi:hypothetical protein